MTDWPEGVTNLDRNVDLVHSPDDEAESGKGYYLSHYGPRKISELYATAEEAMAAYRSGNVRWREDA